MQPPRVPRRRLCVESLEDRTTPNNGVPWLDPTSLTLSFVPDGTNASGTPSNLFAHLGATAPAAWQREILRAYQTWAVQANINIGLVADGGQPMGVTGAPQEDPRFGDVRIGARPLSKEKNDSLAGSSGFDHAGGTWSGDMLLNNVFPFGVGHTDAQHDLFSVAVHEAGNTLGLRDIPSDKAAVMWPKYQVRTGLGGGDVAAIQQLYGPRVADAYEGSGGNGTFGTAYNLTANGNLTAISADVTQVGDADVYKVTTPALLSGVTGLTVKLEAAGISLFTGRVTVYDENLAVVGTAAATDPLANTVALPIPALSYRPAATYYVKIEGAGADVFSAGAYNLRLSYNQPVGLSAVASFTPHVNYEGWSGNEAQVLAQPLDPISAGNRSTFAVGGLLTSSGDVDWFKFTPAVNASGTVTVSAWAWEGSSLLPAVQVYDAAGALLPTEVVANDNGMYTIQLGNRVAGQTYFARVSAADPGGTRATGLYVLGTNLGKHAPSLYDALTGGTLTAATQTVYSTLTVGEARLTQFSLSAATGSPTDAAVRMSVYNAQGRQVFTLAARAGKPMASGAVWLPMGTYTVAYNAATKSGAALPDLSFVVRKRERSNPIDPYPIDPTGDPTGPPPTGPVVVADPPTPTPPPPGAVLDPISDPYSYWMG